MMRPAVPGTGRLARRADGGVLHEGRGVHRHDPVRPRRARWRSGPGPGSSPAPMLRRLAGLAPALRPALRSRRDLLLDPLRLVVPDGSLWQGC